MRAIVIAGTAEESLLPFTTTRPAVLIPVLNMPVIEHLLCQLCAVGITDFLIIAGQNSSPLRDYLVGWRKKYAAVNFVQLASPAELADCLAAELRKVTTPIILADARVYHAEDILAKLVAHYQACPRGILTALAVNTNPLHHLQAKKGEGDKITCLATVTLGQIKINEQSPLADMPVGALIMEAQVASALAVVLKGRCLRNWEEILATIVAEKIGLKTICLAQRFIRLDYPWEILGANFLGLDVTFSSARSHALQIDPTAQIHPTAILKNMVVIGKKVTVEAYAVLDNVVIGDNCKILEHTWLQKAVVGHSSTIGPGGRVQRAVLGAQSNVGYPAEVPWLVGFGKNNFAHHCHAGMGVYGEKVFFAAGVVATANRGEPVKCKILGQLMDTGWVNIGAFIGDNVRLNAQATIMPGRLIGTGAVIGPGVIVYHDVLPYTQLVLKQRLVETSLR